MRKFQKENPNFSKNFNFFFNLIKIIRKKIYDKEINIYCLPFRIDRMDHCLFPSRGKFLTKINSNSHPIEKKRKREEKRETRIPIEFLPLFLAPWFLVRLAAFSIFFPIVSLPPCRKCILARLLAAPWNADGETHKTTIHLHPVPPFSSAPHTVFPRKTFRSWVPAL